jgi:DNA polymerase V
VYACVVVGDSMNGDGIRDGDLIIVDRGQVPVDGDMAVVLLTWKGKRGRVLKRLQEGGTVLESSNPHWPPMHLTPEADPQILGRVIGVLAVGEESCRPAGSTPFSR